MSSMLGIFRQGQKCLFSKWSHLKTFQVNCSGDLERCLKRLRIHVHVLVTWALTCLVEHRTGKCQTNPNPNFQLIFPSFSAPPPPTPTNFKIFVTAQPVNWIVILIILFSVMIQSNTKSAYTSIRFLKSSYNCHFKLLLLLNNLSFCCHSAV